VTILILGATGTLGQEIIRQIDRKDVVCLSRCELKQKQLSAKFPWVKCVLGDIKDRDSLLPHIQDAEIIFHVAALKHIDTLEANPEEAIKTNLIGTMNVVSLAKQYDAHVVFSSTDKAQYPINVYGMCKGISEKLVLAHGFCVFRWANVIGSRGSALHYFIDQIKNDRPINLTDPKMTRFWIRIKDAVHFMLTTYGTQISQEPFGRVRIPPMKAASVMRIIQAIGELLGKAPEYVVTGLRPGEKIHEFIDEKTSSDMAEQYTDAELLELVRPFV